jgi:omega-amidase
MKTALVSLDQIWEDKAANFEKCNKILVLASIAGAELVIFPEMTLTGFTMNIEISAEDEGESSTLAKFCNLCRELQVACVIGVVFKEENDYASNNAVFINSKGQILANYRKIHPFSAAGESEFFLAGKNLSRVDFENLRIGLTICYDLRFPELYSALGSTCNLIINIANWPEKRIDHWITLLKARAIENQIFIVGVNRVGVDGNKISYSESSFLISPIGEISRADFSNEYFSLYDINPDIVTQQRRIFSTTNDRIPEFYKSIL